ncbi:hypothetical protein U1E44_02165 [Arenibacter sp. GZD96]|uniref:hypothetical protein n=1 Tax=Aurantibrevibacter litoralis TaxID=3106030 RepID=UPI002AFFAE00|nr:hypothetical protein [Arenibacter sp. GZD-96]MEA1784884.1 hypothetical protein [Arenibacter sp. GZD-96]
MDRREFTKGILATVTSFALMDSLFAFNAIGKDIKPITDHWAIQLNEYCADLKTNSISTIQWQKKIEELYAKVELQDILKFIDFDNLIKGFDYPDLGVSTKSVKLPKLNGLPERTVFVKKIFGMKKDRAIIPHGHSNMASAHLILNGEMHLRHYEKIHKEGQNLLIKPSIDRIAKVGDSSSISDEKDNVHWFIANTETAFTFDVIILDLNDKNYDIHNLDIYESEDQKNGTLKVPILDVQTALKKYGKQHH